MCVCSRCWKEAAHCECSPALADLSHSEKLPGLLTELREAMESGLCWFSLNKLACAVAQAKSDTLNVLSQLFQPDLLQK